MRNSINSLTHSNKIMRFLICLMLSISLNAYAGQKTSLFCRQHSTPESYVNDLGKQPLNKLIQCGLNVNTAYRIKSIEGETITLTLLQFASMQKDAGLVRELIDNGADPNFIPDKSAYSALSMAIFKQNYSVAFALIESGADTNYIDTHSKKTFYMELAYDKTHESDVNTLFSLLKNGNLDINYQTVNGLTALHLAVANNNKKYVRKLLENGADPCIKDNKEMRPLDLATKRNYIEIQDVLKDRCDEQILGR